MTPTPFLHSLWIGLLLVAWALFGLGGHGVWWGEEAIVLVRVQQLIYGNLTTLADAPLYTLVAALTATLGSHWLAFETASRLASAVFLLASLLLIARTSRHLFGSGFGIAATLSLAGAFGLLLRAHASAPELAALFAYTLLLYGIAVARQDTRRGAIAIALGLLSIVLARTLYDSLAGLVILLLPLAARAWRTPAYHRALVYGITDALLGLAVWALILLGGEAWPTWWNQATALPREWRLGVFKVAAWFAWPLWPLALWAVWDNRRRMARLDALYPLFPALVVTLLLGMWPGLTRDGALLPLLTPLALLAAFGLETLRRGAAQAFYWFGVLCFFFFAALFWFYFAALEWNVHAATAQRLLRMAPDYVQGQINPLSVGIAAFATLFWLLAIPFFPRAKSRPVMVWATGILLTGFLAFGLFRPWIESRIGYRPLWDGMAKAVPAGQCVSLPADPVLRALSQLYLPGRTGVGCRYLLVPGTTGLANAPDNANLVWLGARPGQHDKVYRLYRVAP